MKREFQQLLLEKGRDRMPNVLIAAAECAPISKTGGLADVVGTLPKSLAALGVDARVITPYHRVVKDKYHDKVEHMFSFSVDLGWRSQYVGIERLVVDGVTIYLVDNEYYFGDRIYRGGVPEGEQYAFFTRAVLDAIPNLGFFPDILHCNDWHTAMLPMLLLIFLYSGCIAVAPESIAGEKERGTIATMLITPIKRSDIAIGKICALALIALLSGISSAVGTILSLPKLMGGAVDGLTGDVYGVTDYLMLGVVVIATVLLLITLISIISAFAKSVKEAQTAVVPLMIVVMLIGITAMFGTGAKTEFYYYLIPIYNNVQCMVGIFSFEFQAVNILIAIVSNLVYTLIGVWVLAKMFNSEKIVYSK